MEITVSKQDILDILLDTIRFNEILSEFNELSCNNLGEDSHQYSVVDTNLL